MIRKQLYISEEQERALKQQAQERGMSEAEIMREALDIVLKKQDDEDSIRRQQALQAVLDRARELSKTHHAPEGYKFNREEIYEERMSRWFKNDDDKDK